MARKPVRVFTARVAVLGFGFNLELAAEGNTSSTGTGVIEELVAEPGQIAPAAGRGAPDDGVNLRCDARLVEVAGHGRGRFEVSMAGIAGLVLDLGRRDTGWRI